MKEYWAVLDQTEDQYDIYDTQNAAEAAAENCAKNKPGQSFDVAKVTKRFLASVQVILYEAQP